MESIIEDGFNLDSSKVWSSEINVLSGDFSSKEEEFESTLIQFLNEELGITLEKRISSIFDSNKSGTFSCYKKNHPETYCNFLTYFKDSHYIFKFFLASTKEKTKKVKEWIEKNANKVPVLPIKSGTIFLLTEELGKLKFISFHQIINSKFKENNYSKKVQESRNFILNNICKKDPPGKIVIIQGEPGTGKTYFVKSLISEIENCKIVLIQANQILKLTSPEGISLLSSHVGLHTPILFIIEDADEILAKRTGANMSEISALLNIGDGILGSVFDARVLCTTNTEIYEFDNAITRPGRLLTLLRISKLNKEESIKCLSSLLGKEVSYETLDYFWPQRPGNAPISTFTLAELYEASNKLKEMELENE